MKIPNFLFYYRYPQNLWAKKIFKVISKLHFNEKIKIIDAPCGDGIITYWLKKKLQNEFELYDISEEQIKIAQERLDLSCIYKCDISNLKLDNKYSNIWLLINSLYLLNDVKQIILNNKSIDYIIGVFPNIREMNYHCYKTSINSKINTNEMDIDETISFFGLKCQSNRKNGRGFWVSHP